MVKKKDLIARIEKLEKENVKYHAFLFNSIQAINKKINNHLKSEKKENDKINEWLGHEGIEEIQGFINKGVKR